MKELDALGCAWLCGFADGEGCFHINRRPVEPGKFRYQARLTIVNTDEEMIFRCLNIVGAGAVRKRAKRHKNWKDTYIYECGPSVLKWLLPQMLPYLGKKQQALNLIQCMEVVKMRGRQIGGKYGSRPLTVNEVKICEEMFTNTKKLHKEDK